MKKFKILNLYACLGGNRYKWDEVADNLEITAVELDPFAAELYQERFPNDTVIVADAHQYLLDYYQDFDFIWSSPPCPTHSRARFWGFGANGKNPIYPDMKLYQEIIFLQNHCKSKFLIENVIPYYNPLIEAQERNRHLYWANFKLPRILSDRDFQGLCQTKNEIKNLEIFHDIDISLYKGNQSKVKMLRNLVDYEAGHTILETVLGVVKNSTKTQQTLF